MIKWPSDCSTHRTESICISHKFVWRCLFYSLHLFNLYHKFSFNCQSHQIKKTCHFDKEPTLIPMLMLSLLFMPIFFVAEKTTNYALSILCFSCFFLFVCLLQFSFSRAHIRFSLHICPILAPDRVHSHLIVCYKNAKKKRHKIFGIRVVNFMSVAIIIIVLVRQRGLMPALDWFQFQCFHFSVQRAKTNRSKIIMKFRMFNSQKTKEEKKIYA